MKRKWLIAAAAMVSIGLGMGCQKKTSPPVQQVDDRSTLGDVAPPPEGATDLGTSDVAITPPSTPGTLGGATGAGRIHVAQRGDTLYSLARQYYNDQSQWKRIYEANRSQLANPNQVRVGQKLIIP